MKLGIMQPYFMPYIGYWQLMAAVDTYVIYDNIQYTKKGWFNRNRILQNGEDVYVTIPLRKDSDFLNVNQRSIADSFDRIKLLNQIKSNYHKAPFFLNIYPLIENIIMYPKYNLFDYLFNSISLVKEILSINTKLIVSSTIDIDHSLKGKDKVLAMCKSMHATEYYNSFGGIDLYNKSEFNDAGINLKFLQANLKEYSQLKNKFVPGLSIIDVLMFNSLEQVHSMLNDYNIL